MFVLIPMNDVHYCGMIHIYLDYPRCLHDMFHESSIILRGIPLAICGWAVLICFSRLALGRHYPSDVIAGSLIGAFLEFPVASYLMHRAFPVLLRNYTTM
jgi:hypothetical protein